MKTNELKQMDTSALKKELLDLLKEQFNLRMQHATRQLVQTHQLKAVRHKISRVRSVLQEKASYVI